MVETTHQAIKPWKSIDEQLAILEKRRLLIEDRPEAIEFLKRYGYYRLSGYSYPMRDLNSENELFKQGASFKKIVALYNFDRELKFLTLRALEKIEINLRVAVSYTMGKVNPLFYKDLSYFKVSFTRQGKAGEKSTHDVWNELLKEQLAKNKNSEECIKHNIKKYGYSLPVWVCCQVWNFGELSKLIEGLKNCYCQKIAHLYLFPDTKTFCSVLRGLVILRNLCAHHLRLWNRQFSYIPSTSPSFKQDANWIKELSPCAYRRVFFFLCLISHFMQQVDPLSDWPKEVKTLISRFPNCYPLDIGIKNMGAPCNWAEIWTEINKKTFSEI